MMSDHQTRGGPPLSPKWNPSRPSRPPLCFLCYIHGDFLADCPRLPVTLQREAVENRAAYERNRDSEETRSLPSGRSHLPRSRGSPAPPPSAREMWPSPMLAAHAVAEPTADKIRVPRVKSHPEMVGKLGGRQVETIVIPKSRNGKPSRQLWSSASEEPTDAVGSAHLFQSHNYKLGVSVGLTRAVLFPVRSVLDTGAGPNLVREDILPSGWDRLLIPNLLLSRITNASGRRMPAKGVITLFVQVGTLVRRVRF
jgi:hypothetical protein